MALLGSKQHTAGDTALWTIDYAQWLGDSGTKITQIDVQSSSATCAVGDISILGPEINFFLVGGVLNERLIVALTMTDNLGNIKHDTISFTVVAP